MRSIKEIEFVHGATGGLVELHHRLTANPYLLAADFAALWNEREEAILAGRPVAVHARSAKARRLDWLLRRLYRTANWYDAAPKRAVRYALWERLYRLSLKSDWLRPPGAAGLVLSGRLGRLAAAGRAVISLSVCPSVGLAAVPACVILAPYASATCRLQLKA